MELKEKMGGFDCEFVEPPPDVLQTECPVCLLIIQEPHQVTCCGHNFCFSCIERVKKADQSCPICKKKGFSDFPDSKLKRTLYTFKVYCSHKEDGCEWMGELRQLEAHLNKDPHPEKQLDGCQFAEIDCLYECGDQLQRQHMHTHQSKHCKKRILVCEYCHNYECSYENMVHNHWPVCGSFPLCCPNKCGLLLPRQNYRSHIKDECLLTIIKCDFHHVGCTVKLPRKNMSEHLKENLLMHTSLLATSHAKQQAEISSYKNKTLQLQQTVNNLKKDNAQLKTSLAMALTNTSTSIQSTTIPLAPPVLTMVNFQHHKKNKMIWLSPPIYTHNQGYKICLRVDAGGHGNDSFVSVMVYFMKGEFDDLLKWPFRGAIQLQLLDQYDGSKGISHTFKYDDSIRDSACSRVTAGEMSVTGCGESRFIAHSMLKPRYLQNDTLLIQVDKVKLR